MGLGVASNLELFVDDLTVVRFSYAEPAVSAEGSFAAAGGSAVHPSEFARSNDTACVCLCKGPCAPQLR